MTTFPTFDELVKFIASSDAFFKQQSKDDPELSQLEREDIVRDLHSRSLPLFLERYHSIIPSKFINCLCQCDDDSYTVGYYINQIKLRSDQSCKAAVKRRRYLAMKRLEDQGSYFSEAEMKFREPHLYHEYIGQYLTAEEQFEQASEIDSEDPSLSGFLMRHARHQDENARFAHSQMQEDMESETFSLSHVYAMDEDDIKTAVDEDRNLLRDEFASIMRSKFLTGEDMNVDYSEIDKDDSLDMPEELERDLEEEYFDSELPD